jgi:hypothetical protein
MPKKAIVAITEITDENREDLTKLALSMYLEETCPYCLRQFETLEDLNDAVYNGYTQYGRIAHKVCFDKAKAR